jgi:hypothetical protein
MPGAIPLHGETTDSQIVDVEDAPSEQRATLPSLGTVKVDPNWSDEETVRFAANQVLAGRQTPTGPITAEDIDNWITDASARGTLVRGEKTGDPEKDSQFTVFQDMLDQIYASKQKSGEQLKTEATARTMLPTPDEDLQVQAKQSIERRQGHRTYVS